MRIPMKQALKDRENRPDEIVASGPQIEMVFRRGQKTLSLRAQKIWHLLVKKAGVRLGDATLHRMPISELYEIGHMPQAARIEAMRELQTTLVEVTTIHHGEKPRIESSGLLVYVARDVDDGGTIEWEFGRVLRSVFASSDHWAILSKRAIMAFESRYSLRLYEMIALRNGLEHKTSEIFDIETLRDRLGVPAGKLERWQDLRRKGLETAIAEVSFLAGFRVSYEAIKKGRAVFAVKLSWSEKSSTERAATKRELDSSKVGRKARRAGTVETVVEPVPVLPHPVNFPAFISQSDPWRHEARRVWNDAHPSVHCPDVDRMAEAFRQSRTKAGRALSGSDVWGHWQNFVRKFSG